MSLNRERTRVEEDASHFENWMVRRGLLDVVRPIWEQLEAKSETESCSRLGAGKISKSVQELESVLELELEPEKQRFYDSPPPRMDVSVCCLPASAGSGAQHPHPASLPSGGQPTIQQPYQYADQIVPDRGQPDGLPVLGCTGQDNWQQISSASNVVGAVTAAATATTTYIDYSWLQMQVRSYFPFVFLLFLLLTSSFETRFFVFSLLFAERKNSR